MRNIIHIILLSAVITAALSSCQSVHKAMDKHPEDAAKECAIRFPVQETTITVQSDTVTLHDTLEMDRDPVIIEVPCPESPKPTVVKVACPPCKDRIVTEYKTITVTKETKVRDTAAETVLKNDLAAVNAKSNRQAKTIRILFWLLIPLILAVAFAIYYKIKTGALKKALAALKA